MGCTLVKEEVGFVSGMTFTETTINYYNITSCWSPQLTVLYDTDVTVHSHSVGCYKVLMSALRNRTVITLNNRHIMTKWLELWELPYSVISVLHVPLVKFLTNVSSRSVIRKTTKKAVLLFTDQLSFRAQCYPHWLKLMKNPWKQNKGPQQDILKMLFISQSASLVSYTQQCWCGSQTPLHTCYNKSDTWDLNHSLFIVITIVYQDRTTGLPDIRKIWKALSIWVTVWVLSSPGCCVCCLSSKKIFC
jgi:hypothetical protein